ncbi:hypothetical protein B0H17DRAFT_1210851 [Mycena rosella]|uniref:Uncharacterized protein n=1 Tax=Mycena rosella TaxID=1033263 RepID=A0AAD7CW06_MYCRO|nr:hypothetical protein B0H17DRAFT_1210851 [Mycena rosella]
MARTEWAQRESTIFRQLRPTPSNPPSEEVSAYFQDFAPSLCPKDYVATLDDIFSANLVHHNINAALAKNTKEPLVQFLVVVAMIHDIGHHIRRHFWLFDSRAKAIEEFPYFWEECTPGSWFSETGFDVEIALFGGIIGVVFEDENPSDLPFFEVNYARIQLFLSDRSGQGPKPE